MNMSLLRTVSVLSLLTCSGAAWAQDASPAPAADNQLDAIIVTAERRSANLQDVPIAVSAVSAKMLQQSGARDPRDLQQMVPNLQFNSTNAGSATAIFVRGVGIADTNATTTGAVGVYVDDVFVAANAGKMFNVFDSAGIEVLRGPQGTLYGRNTTGGAIKFTSKTPTNDVSGDLDVRYGNFNEVRVEGGLGGPIVEDRLKVRVSGMRETRDGVMRNLVTGHKLNDIDIWGARAIVDFTPTPDFLARLTINGARSNGSARQFVHRGQGVDFAGAPNFAPDGTPLDGFGYADTDGNIDTGSYNVEGKERIKTFGVNLKLEQTFDWGSVTSISSYQKVDRDTVEDTDASPNDILTSYAHEAPRSYTQELRAQSNKDGALTWIVGGFYLHDKLPTDSAFDILRGLRDPTAPFNGADPANTIGFLRYPYTQTTKSYALFGQADYRFTDKLTGTLGLRYSHDKIAMDYHSFFEEPGPITIADLVTVKDSVSFKDLSYRLALNYKTDGGTLVYGSFSKGYNAGGYPGGSTIDSSQMVPYKPEHLYAYEAGVKTEFFDHKLRFNNAAFYYDYKDIQVFLLEFLDANNTVPIQRKSNAQGAEIYGFETEILAVPVSGLEISLSGGYTHSKYRRFLTLDGDLAGRQLVDSPRLNGSLSISYTQEVGEIGAVTGRVEGFYSDRVQFLSTNERAFSQGAYANGNASLTFKPGRGDWDASLWVKNFTDKRTLVTASKLITMDELSYNDPRTYGVRFGYHF
jgi:iron complex outermembrane receptor protein